MKSACRGEEGQYFRDMIETLKHTLATMPKTYETEDMSEDMKKATLHYFKGGSDWYIIEKDYGCPDDIIKGTQQQAYGFACLNGDDENAESGYISIQELIENGVELDLYYKPETVETIKARFGKTESIKTNLDTWFEEGTCPAEGCPEGCFVELDGRCSHGYVSTVMAMGLI